MAATDTRLVRLAEAIVAKQAAQRQQLRGSLFAAIRRRWALLENKYAEDQVTKYIEAVAAAVRAAQKQEARTAAAALRQQLRLLDADPGDVVIDLPERPRGVDQELVVVRPVRDFRRFRLEGLDEATASTRAERRALVTADSDLTLAGRQAAQQVLQASPSVIGYRRVLRPELSAGGTCGLCIVASDRIYRAAELMPVHDRCKCVVAPVVSGGPDPGELLNRADLTALYRAAGSTGAADLAKVRLQEVRHGELGPLLAAAGHDVTTPAQAAGRRAASAKDVRVDSAAVLATAEKSIADLEARAANGEDVTGPLTYQRDLAARMREQLATP